MAQYAISVPPQSPYQLHTDGQRSFADAHRFSTSGPPFINLFDPQINSAKLPRAPEESRKKTRFLPPFLALMLGSTYFLVALCIVLVIPILQLAIGAAYQNQCPVNPNIPVYLIVAGACGCVSIGLAVANVSSLHLIFLLDSNLTWTVI